MIVEQSFGIIPLRKTEKRLEVLLVKHKAGHWAFPKGHPEKGESPKETALRELFEEVGLKAVQFLFCSPLDEHYEFQRNGAKIIKSVTYFPAFVEGEVVVCKEEIQEAKWATLEDAENLCTFQESKSLCRLLTFLEGSL